MKHETNTCNNCTFITPQHTCACGDSYMYFENVSVDFACLEFKEKTTTL